MAPDDQSNPSGTVGIVGRALAALRRLFASLFGRHESSAARSRIDPFTVSEPWRRMVQDTLRSQNRFREAAGRMRPGPTRDRLRDLEDRVASTVDEAWRTARAGSALSSARRDLDVIGTRAKFERLTALPADAVVPADAVDAPSTPEPGTQATIDALTARLESAARMDEQIATATSQLTVLNARLDEAVTRSIELSVRDTSPDDFAAIETNLSDVSHELEALRVALSLFFLNL